VIEFLGCRKAEGLKTWSLEFATTGLLRAGSRAVAVQKLQKMGRTTRAVVSE
jgi:hypothetical protein